MITPDLLANVRAVARVLKKEAPTPAPRPPAGKKG